MENVKSFKKIFSLKTILSRVLMEMLDNSSPTCFNFLHRQAFSLSSNLASLPHGVPNKNTMLNCSSGIAVVGCLFVFFGRM